MKIIGIKIVFKNMLLDKSKKLKKNISKSSLKKLNTSSHKKSHLKVLLFNLIKKEIWVY